MEKLHHSLWIVELANRLLGPLVAPLLGQTYVPGMTVIPDYLVMCGLIVLLVTVFSLAVRSSLSVENPGKLQIVLEEIVGFVVGMLKDNIGPQGVKYLPLVGTVFIFIFLGNMFGKVPGLMSPTASLNVTLGCAITVWVYYHLQGILVQGPVGYVAHFFTPPGVPMLLGPLVGVIELVSHTSRVLSLSLRLFGNVFGEELVVLILASLVPFLVPLPMMLLGVITGSLQAYIFALLTVIYLAGAVHVAHEHEEHEHEHAEAGHGHAPAEVRAA
jgi:F-type H+-transporting ATPase subunit a